MQRRKWALIPVGGREAHQNENCCYYISHYADLCQIRGCDWIKLGPEPQNLWKLFVDFLFFNHHVEQKKKEEKFHYLVAGSDSIPTSDCSLRCVRIKALYP